jgi:quercetin dioxygenase-like cupin family protein
MIKHKLTDFWRGWFIGNFEPSVFKTEDFEIGLLLHEKGEVWPTHYHKIATEYNLLLEGSMTICGQDVNPGEIFIIEPGEIAKPTFHKDCKILCVKAPSLPKDKYIV